MPPLVLIWAPYSRQAGHVSISRHQRRPAARLLALLQGSDSFVNTAKGRDDIATAAAATAAIVDLAFLDVRGLWD